MGSLLAFLSALAYSSGYILIRTGVRRGDPDGGAFITTVVNAVLLGGAALLVLGSRDLDDVAPEGLAWFAVAGVLGPFVGRILLFGGIHRLGPVRASSVVNTAPLITVALAVTLLNERLSPLAVAATTLVVVGLGVLTFEAFQQEDRFENRLEAVDAEAAVPDAADESADDAVSRTERVRRRLGTVLVVGLLLSGASAVAFGFARTARGLGLQAMPDPLVGAAVGAMAGLATHLVVNGYRRRLALLVRTYIVRPRPRLWVAGALSAFGLFTFFAALTFAPLAHVAVIAASETIITLLLSTLLLRRSERLSPAIVIPAACVFAGGALIALS